MDLYMLHRQPEDKAQMGLVMNLTISWQAYHLKSYVKRFCRSTVNNVCLTKCDRSLTFLHSDSTSSQFELQP
jgi:hypothetical protein